MSLEISVSARQVGGFERLREEVRREVQLGELGAAEAGAAFAQAIVPHSSGHLASTIRGYTSGYTVVVAATAEYANIVEEGSKPHWIGGEGQRLRNEETGFSAIGPVYHPGTHPQPFMEQTLRAVEEYMEDYLEGVGFYDE